MSEEIKMFRSITQTNYLALDSIVANGFPYLGKNEKRASSQPLCEFVVPKLIEPYSMKEVL